MKRFILFFVANFVTGCNDPNAVRLEPVRIPDAEYEDFLEDLIKAEDILEHPIYLDIGSPIKVEFIIPLDPANPGMHIEFSKCDHYIRGHNAITIAHELGHVFLGSGHTETGLMSRSISGTDLSPKQIRTIDDNVARLSRCQ